MGFIFASLKIAYIFKMICAGFNPGFQLSHCFLVHDSPAKDVLNAWLPDQLIDVNNDMVSYHSVLGVLKTLLQILLKKEWFKLINPIEAVLIYSPLNNLMPYFVCSFVFFDVRLLASSSTSSAVKVAKRDFPFAVGVGTVATPVKVDGWGDNGHNGTVGVSRLWVGVMAASLVY